MTQIDKNCIFILIDIKNINFSLYFMLQNMSTMPQKSQTTQKTWVISSQTVTSMQEITTKETSQDISNNDVSIYI